MRARRPRRGGGDQAYLRGHGAARAGDLLRRGGVVDGVFGWGTWRRSQVPKGPAAGRGPRSGRSRRRCAPSAKIRRWQGRPCHRAAHFFILWGFLAALVATVILTVDTDVVRNVSGLITGHQDSFFHGTFFIVFTFVVDTMGFAFLVAGRYMAVRRGVLRPRPLAYGRAGTPAGGYSRKPW